MKVVLFCGGQGLRLRGHADEPLPKPMTHIGYRPILWHLMKYYAHFGHTDFVLCLGYRADAIKEYFLGYDERLSNDFVLSEGGRSVTLLGSDIHDWTITFVDTGVHASVGERLAAVAPHVRNEEVFLANYSDGLTDLDHDAYLEEVLETDCVASFVAVQPAQSFHVVDIGDEGLVHGVHEVSNSDTWINGGFFVLRREIFDVLGPGEDLVDAPFTRLMQQRKVYAHRYRGFWRPMDTFKDRMVLEDLYARDDAPWQVWRRDPTASV